MSSAPAVRALLLDLDDTLIDTRSAMIAAARAGFAAVCPDVPDTIHVAAADRFQRDPEGHLRAYTEGRITFADQRSARFRDAVVTLGLERCCGRGQTGLTAREHALFEDRYSAGMRAATRAFPDAEVVLRHARACGMSVGVVTNSSTPATRMKLEVTGLARLLDVVVTTDTLGFGKPAPRVFQHACELLGADPWRTAYVGDDLELDALAARDAGLVSHWLVRGSRPVTQPRDVALVRTLVDVCRLVAPDLGDCEPAR